MKITNDREMIRNESKYEKLVFIACMLLKS